MVYVLQFQELYYICDMEKKRITKSFRCDEVTQKQIKKAAKVLMVSESQAVIRCIDHWYNKVGKNFEHK